MNDFLLSLNYLTILQDLYLFLGPVYATLITTETCLTFPGFCAALSENFARIIGRRQWRLLPEEQADVEAEGGEEAHIQQDDHQQVPPPGPPGTTHVYNATWDTTLSY